MKKVTDKLECYYWQDDDGNRWRTSAYTKRQAETLSKTLTNCKDCLECSNCSGCVRCTTCEFCSACVDCVGCAYCSGCTKCSTVAYAMHCNRCLCCSHCTACDYCVNIDHCSCIRNKINGTLLANIKDGGDLERAAMLCSLSTDMNAVVGKWGSATVESGARLWLIFGEDNILVEYPADNGEEKELVDIYKPNYDPIHPIEISETHRKFVLWLLPKEAVKLVRLWQKVVAEDDAMKRGQEKDAK